MLDSTSSASMWNFSRKLVLPLLGQVRRTQHGQPPDLAAIEQLARDEAGLDGLADADVVGDQQPHRIELERHHQRHELVGPRLDRDAPEAAERTGGRARREPCRIAQQPPGGEIAKIRLRWAAETSPTRPARRPAGCR